MEPEDTRLFAGKKWSALRKRFRLIVLCMITAALGAGLLSLLQPKIYRATTHLLIAESKLADLDSKATNFVYYELLRSYETLINNDNHYLVSKTIDKFDLQKPPYSLRVESFRRRGILRVELSKSTRLLEVTVEFPNARLAAEICNYFVNEAVAFNEELNSRDAEKARLFLKEQLDRAGQSMEVARQSLLEFNRSSTIEGLRESVRRLLAEGSENETELAALNLELTRNSAKKDSLAASSSGASDPAIQFRIVEMQSETAGIKAAIEKLRKTLETNKQTLARLEKDKAVKESKQQQLLDEYDLARESYATLSKKYQDASINVGARSTDLKMITPAVVPERPFKPRVLLNIILAAGFGLLVSVSLSFLIHNLETSRAVKESAFSVEEKIVEVRRQGKGV